MRLLSKLVFAAGAIIAPLITSANPAPDWQLFGSSSYYTVDIDTNSLKVTDANGGLEVTSKIRITYAKELETFHEGKKIRGAYSISEITAVCDQDKIVFHTSSLYDKANNVIATKKIGDVANPHNEGTFLTAYLKFMCHSAQNNKPRLTV